MANERLHDEWQPEYREVRLGHAQVEETDSLAIAPLDDRDRGTQSRLEETNLGGLLEAVPGLDTELALNDGYPITVARPAQGGEEEGFRPEAIFNEGEPWTRVTNPSAAPWRAVVHLRMTYETWRTADGTGWMAAPDTVITAGHNLFSPHGDGWAVNGVEVTAGRDGGTTGFPTVRAKLIDVLPGWSVGLDPRSDFGVIKLVDDRLGRRTGFFGSLNLSNTELSTRPLVHGAGYPAGRGRTMWVDAGRVNDFTDDFLDYRLDSLKGNSGGPIFMRFRNGQRRVVATHVQGIERVTNKGLRMSGDVYRAFRAWIQ